MVIFKSRQGKMKTMWLVPFQQDRKKSHKMEIQSKCFKINIWLLGHHCYDELLYMERGKRFS